MDKSHYEKTMNNIARALKMTNFRVAKSFACTEMQLNLAERILRACRVVDAIPDTEKLIVMGTRLEAWYLFKYSNLKTKNIIFFADIYDATDYFDELNGGKIYPVRTIQELDFNLASYVLIIDFEYGEKYHIALNDYNYTGKIVSIHDRNDRMPFFAISATERLSGNDYLSGMYQLNYGEPSEVYLSLVDRIQKINSKLDKCRGSRIVIYGAGGHTYFLLKYTCLKYENVIMIFDKSAKDFFGLEVQKPSEELFEMCDYVVISSHRYQNEMVGYINNMCPANKIVCLYDENDDTEFYENTNTFSPDIVYKRDEIKKYSIEDVKIQAEEKANIITNNSDFYMTYKIRPDYDNMSGAFYRDDPEVSELKGYFETNRDFAIIIQGQIIFDNNFTYKTVLFYKRLFPGATIIISTWEADSRREEFKELENLGIEVVVSSYPIEKGIMHVNYQAKSSYAGIVRARELGKKYCIKTRSDFRIYEKSTLQYLKCLLERYLPRDNKQISRLVTLPPYLDAPYYIPDFIMAGATEEMLSFWVEPEKDETLTQNPEMLLYSQYFKKIERYVQNVNDNILEYVQMLSESLIVVDQKTFDLIWKKYTYEEFERGEVQGNRFYYVDWLVRQ